MNLTRAILSTCAVASSIVCISAYSVASSEPSVNFTVAKPCSQESAPKPKMEILEPLGPLHAIAEPDILEAFKSRVGAMKASGEYDRRFNQNKDRIARELEHPTPGCRIEESHGNTGLGIVCFRPGNPTRISSSPGSVRPHAASVSFITVY